MPDIDIHVYGLPKERGVDQLTLSLDVLSTLESSNLAGLAAYVKAALNCDVRGMSATAMKDLDDLKPIEEDTPVYCTPLQVWTCKAEVFLTVYRMQATVYNVAPDTPRAFTYVMPSEYIVTQVHAGGMSFPWVQQPAWACRTMHHPEEGLVLHLCCSQEGKLRLCTPSTVYDPLTPIDDILAHHSFIRDSRPPGSTVKLLCHEETQAKKDSKSMQIFVKTLTGKIWSLIVEPATTFEEVHQMLQIREQGGLSHAKLIYAGKILERGRTVGEYGIRSESSLHVVLRLGGGMMHQTSGRWVVRTCWHSITRCIYQQYGPILSIHVPRTAKIYVASSLTGRLKNSGKFAEEEPSIRLHGHPFPRVFLLCLTRLPQ